MPGSPPKGDDPILPAEAVEATPTELEKAGYPLTPYDGKVVETTGEILNFPDDGSEISLKTEGYVPFRATLFEIGPDYPQKRNELAARLVPGQTVTLRGAQQPKAGTSGRWIWRVTKEGPNPAPILQAEEFTKAFATDRAGTKARYNKRAVYVIGEVGSVGPADEGGDLTLKGADGVTVLCDFSEPRKGVKAGDRVQVMGVFEELITEDEQIGLAICQFITVPLPVQGVEYAKSVP